MTRVIFFWLSKVPRHPGLPRHSPNFPG